MTKLIGNNIPFRHVDSRYRNVENISYALGLLIFGIAAIVFAVLMRSVIPSVVEWLIPGGIIILCLWLWWLSLRQIKVIGYYEDKDELIIRTGIMFQSLTVVPYGRMQQIKVTHGPLMRRFGLASVELVTASADTDATIPGVAADEAERLRKKLTELGNANLEGL